MSDPLDAADDFNHAGPRFRQRADAIERAVATERERCAKIAERYVERTNADIAHAILNEIRQLEK